MPRSSLRFVAVVALVAITPFFDSIALAEDDPHAACGGMSYVPVELLQRPTVLHAGVGNTHESVSTTSKEAQAYYDQGLNYLESYVWIEAARSFRQALRADPSLAMAWLGLSRTYSGLDDTTAAWAALHKAQALLSNASPLEARRIALRGQQLAAMAAIGDTARHHAYKQALDAALAEFPDDIQLLLVRGNAEEPTAAGRGQRGNVRSVPFYERVLELQSDHATAHHFLVHTDETIGKVSEALQHGEAYAKNAPAIPHAHHMWAHDLRRVGRMDEAIRGFLTTDSLERRYYRAERISASMDWHHGHNLDLLAGCYQWQGRVSEARRVLEDAGAAPAFTSYEQANRRSLPLLFLAHDRPRDAMAAARRMMTASKIPSTTAFAHVFLGQAQLERRRVADAERELAAADAALAQVPIVTAGQNVKRSAVQPYVDELRGELWLAQDKKAEGRELLRKVISAYRSVPGPDAWAQALFRVEAIGRFAREHGDWELAGFAARQMNEHDEHYGGTHLARALVAEHESNAATAARERTAALEAWHLADRDVRALADAPATRDRAAATRGD